MSSNPFTNAMAQLDKVVSVKKFNDRVIEQLRRPNREITASIPLELDNGSTIFLEGYRVQYNNCLGVYKGGIRYHQATDINEVRALAFWMSLKCSLAGIPMGGAKGGITVDPTTLSLNELERLSRGWVRAFVDVIGPSKDVPAPDVNTNGLVMAWMADEYAKLTGDHTGAVITGKPVGRGGSLGREAATAQGGYYVFEALRHELGLDQPKLRVVVQGFGNVGSNVARLFSQAGHLVMAISDCTGGIYKPDGLDVASLLERRQETPLFSDFKLLPGEKRITNKKLMGLDCDVLIPAVLENTITEANVASIKTRLILELANGPVTPAADQILADRSIPVIPDILANSGGVIVSYFEWFQNLNQEVWDEAKVNQKLAGIIKQSAKTVSSTAKANQTTLRMGAFISAIDRLAK